MARRPAKRWTPAELTDSQLTRLSQLYREAPHGHGSELIALLKMELIEEVWHDEGDPTLPYWQRKRVVGYRITPNGRLLFEQAKAAGW